MKDNRWWTVAQLFPRAGGTLQIPGLPFLFHTLHSKPTLSQSPSFVGSLFPSGKTASPLACWCGQEESEGIELCAFLL